MDRITKQLINDYLSSEGMNSKALEEDFEIFVNYCALSKEYNRTFDARSITIGGGNDTGIDGLAIIVNGYLVEDIDEVSDLLDQNGYLDVAFVFVQSKTSSSFESKEIGSFCFGVKDFFSETPGLIRNDDIAKCADITDFILSHAASFKDNPKCTLYYVTTGRWNNDDNHMAVINATISDLESYNIFGDVTFYPVGASELSRLYRQTKNPNIAEFTFSEKVTLPDIEGISEAYYGILPFSEFKKILIDESDNIRSIFDDNVRDFQGANNPVNKKITATLESEHTEQFAALNNGVTVVARSLKTSGNKFILNDFQIVNGCQTSNVLYHNRGSERVKNLYVPFRLIVTEEDGVKSQITLATNNQTAIKTEQLAVLSEFQRSLELYYASIEGDGRLYYERRAKQYSNDGSVTKNRIITVANQVKAFSAMFIQNPHMVTSFFGSIAKRLGSEGSPIFHKDHSHAPYYLSGLAFYKLDALFKSGQIDPKYRKIKFHLLMLFRLLAQEEEMPPLNNQRKMEKYCTPIITKLLDADKCSELFKKATDLVDSSGVDITDSLHYKQASVVDKLINKQQESSGKKTLITSRSSRPRTAAPER